MMASTPEKTSKARVRSSASSCSINKEPTQEYTFELNTISTELRMTEALATAGVGSWEYDVITHQVFWSEELYRLVGRDPALGPPDYEAQLRLCHPDDVEYLQACVERAIHDGVGYELDLRLNAATEAEQRWYHGVGNPIMDSQGNVVRLVGTLMDITERKQYEEELKAAHARLAAMNGLLEEQILLVNQQSVALECQKCELEEANRQLEALATTDGLTGIHNHRAFQERLMEEYQRSVRYNSPLSLVMVDVDHFKKFNDTFGHPEGDRVLQHVARILEATVRTTDFVARYGGEEFVVLLPETDTLGAIAGAERLRMALEQEEWTLRAITASIGVATLSSFEEQPDELLAEADKALYLSKQRGRNCTTHADDVVDPPEMDNETAQWYEDILLQLLASQTETLETASERFKETLIDAFESTIEGWANMLDQRDKETKGHSKRVADLTERLARYIGMNEEEVLSIRWGAMLHDIGKIGICDAILHKPAPLTEEERELMQRHTVLANDILSPITFLNAAADIPYCHHEKWD